MADDRRQQLADDVAEHIWGVLAAASGVTTDPNVLAHAAAQNLLPLLDRVAADAAAEALEQAADEATDAWVTWRYNTDGEWAMTQSTLHARAAELRAPARTDEEN